MTDGSGLMRIGLTTYRERAAWGVWDEPADLLPASYADSVSAAGAVPLLLPPSAGEADLPGAAREALGGVHGLVLCGGPDVDPARYGAQPDTNTGAPRPGRDAWEIALTRGALDLGMPLLAICRGMQLLNVTLGGTLIQHLPDAVGHTLHCPVVGEHVRHDVRIDPDGRLGAALGSAATVPSYHHQGLDRIADGLVATGWTEDGVVEAVELDGRAWVVGVQWHPEVADGAALFAEFVGQCARAAARSAADPTAVPASS